jgi:RNA polymerase sigma factor (sigma-70 family)
VTDDCEEFNEFFRVEFVLLTAFLRRCGYDLEESRDAAAEAMFRALRRWAHIETPHAWVRVAAQRIALRHRAQQRKLDERVTAARSLGQDLGPDPSVEVVDQLRVIALLVCLPPRQREVMNWYLDGFKANEIAGALNVTEATVRSNLRHAREQLKRRLDDGLDRPPGGGTRQ